MGSQTKGKITFRIYYSFIVKQWNVVFKVPMHWAAAEVRTIAQELSLCKQWDVRVINWNGDNSP